MDDFKKTLTELLQANLDLETIAYAMEYDTIEDLDRDTIEAYGFNLVKLARIENAKGFAKVIQNLNSLAARSPQAMKLLLETLEEKAKTQEVSEISITILEPDEEIEAPEELETIEELETTKEPEVENEDKPSDSPEV